MTDQVTDPDLTQTPTPDEDKSSATDKGNQQSSSDGEDWKLRYTGQQKTMAKKDEHIAKLTKQLEDLAGQLEELKPLVDTRTKEKENLEATRQTLEQELAAARSEAEAIKRQLAHSAIIMQEHPQIAPLAKYIPEAETEEVYRQNATAFATAVQSLIDQAVKNVLSGAAPPQPKGNDGLVTTAAIDAAWNKVVSLAGVPGKEKEYEEARLQWVSLQPKTQ